MKLKCMTLDELWNLFPITFVDANANFKNIYIEEEQTLKFLLGNYIERISHIGSNSIENIKTKPIIDILIEMNLIDILDSILGGLLESHLVGMKCVI